MNNKLLYMLENIPEDTYTKDAGSNLYKLLDAIGEELELFTNKLEEIRDSRYLGFAKGDSIDRIAKLLNMYRLFNETDEEFTTRILAKVPSFIGGGTVNSIETIIRDYLKANATVIEHYKQGNEFDTFVNGIMSGFNIYKEDDLDLTFTIKSGYFYIDGSRYKNDSDTYNLDIIGSNNEYYIFANTDDGLVLKTENTALQNEILLYSISTINDEYIIDDRRFILNPEIHQITNAATISVQLAFNIDESILTKDEVKSIIMETKAAGIAVILIFSEILEELVNISEHLNPFFNVGSSTHAIGTNCFIGYDRNFESLIQDGYENFEQIRNLTFKEVGASTIGGIQ